MTTQPLRQPLPINMTGRACHRTGLQARHRGWRVCQDYAESCRQKRCSTAKIMTTCEDRCSPCSLEDGAPCLPSRCRWLPPCHSFIHIPKTGGTSMEAAAARLGLEVLWSPRKTHPSVPAGRARGVGTAWHLPPDSFERIFGVPRSPNGKPLLCVVRQPADRLRSESAWRCGMTAHGNKRFTPGGKPCSPTVTPEAKMAEEAQRVLDAESRESLEPFDDNLVHMLPQSWFVWDDRGRVRCSCVVAFPKLALLAGLPQQNAQSHGNVGWMSSAVFPKLYAHDERLFLRANAARELCYRPEPVVRG